ncbi:hypothetical protein [Facilibium subflavum]|uniref:hypothetical protein n=1 Tax=Facilibium subflavum TaxID=2219058 RepID=UPI000E648498|nr:hypothetical protein [Facilibium subflavum]
MLRKLSGLLLLSSMVIGGYAGPHREVTFGQINIINNGTGVMVCGVGGFPSYTGEANEKNVYDHKFMLPYMKSPVGEHFNHDDTMGSGALSPYLAYYSNNDGKNMAMFELSGWVVDTSYNSDTSHEYEYSPVSLDYYSYNTDQTMQNLIRVGFGAAYKITENTFSAPAEDKLNPFSEDVFTSTDLDSLSGESFSSHLEPTAGWYTNGRNQWGNIWFTHQYIYRNGVFSHAFKFLSSSADDHADKYDKPDSMGVACLIYDSKDSADARAAYGNGLLGSFKIRFKLYPSSKSASIQSETDGKIDLYTDSSESATYGPSEDEAATIAKKTFSVNY